MQQDTHQVAASVGKDGRNAARASRPLWKRILARVIFFYVVWCTVLYFYQDKLLFPRDLTGPPLKRLYNSRTEQLERNVPGVGKVVAWVIRPPGLAPGAKTPLVVYFHGNAELIDDQDVAILRYERLGFSILLPEYRGYGRSAGTPSEEAIVSDAIYFFDETLKRPDIDPSKIVIHGRSVGGGPAARLAAVRKPKALILESTFSSAASMAHKYWAPAFLAKNPFHTDRVVESLDIPILIFHGTHDSIIPVWHGRALRDLARKCTYVEFDCDHNDFPGTDNDGKYWGHIEQFLRDSGMAKMSAEWKMAPQHPTEKPLDSKSPGAAVGHGRLMRRFAVTAATLYVGYAAFMYFCQGAVLFPPLPTSSDDGFPRNMDKLSIDVPQGGQVEAWFAPAPNASAEKPAPVVIFFHGQLELIDYHAATVKRLGELGCSVLLPEYRGSGRSTAALNEAGLLDDSVREYDEILHRPDVDRSRIVFMGRSLGGASAVALATKRLPRAMILEATFASLPELAPHYWIPSFMARFAFPTERRLASLDMPVFIAHGLYDWAVPISHGHRLRDAARHATYIEYPTGHVGFINDENYWEDVGKFLNETGVIDHLPIAKNVGKPVGPAHARTFH